MYEKIKSSGKGKLILSALFVFVICYLIYFFVAAYFFTAVKAQSFYAVFLDNGQVYFGKVTTQTQHEIVLDYVFYLKADTDLSTASGDMPNANLSLVKLGNELYKPMDQMLINRDHILFLEEMRPGSEILQAIEKYAQQNK